MSFLTLLTLLPLALAGATKYTISPSSHPEYCLAPSSAQEGSDLVLKPCDSSPDIVFALDGDELRNTDTDMCIDVRDGSDKSTSGTLLQMWGCFGYNSNQRFDVVGDEVKWVGFDLCLDLKDGLGEDGNQIQVWSCYSHNTNQRWTLTEAEEVDADADEDCDDDSAPASTDDADEADSDDDDEEKEDEDLPLCDTGDDQQSQSYVRRGRGQHYQRSLDNDFIKLDRSYIPHAPALDRRSRRRAITHISPTSTGL